MLPEFRVSWVVEELGLFFCLEMIQVAEEFVEAVHRGQITVQIAEMILPELSRGVAERLERLGDSNVAVLQADRRAWDADFGEAGTQSALPGIEGRAAAVQLCSA